MALTTRSPTTQPNVEIREDVQEPSGSLRAPNGRQCDDFPHTHIPHPLLHQSNTKYVVRVGVGDLN